MKAFVSLLALFIATTAAQAGGIYQQAPNVGISGYLSSTYSNGGNNLERFVWDSSARRPPVAGKIKSRS